MESDTLFSGGRRNGPVSPGVLVCKEKTAASYISLFDSETEFLSKSMQRSSNNRVANVLSASLYCCKQNWYCTCWGNPSLKWWQSDISGWTKMKVCHCLVFQTPSKTISYLYVSTPLSQNNQEWSVILKDILTTDLSSSPSNFPPT